MTISNIQPQLPIQKSSSKRTFGWHVRLFSFGTSQRRGVAVKGTICIIKVEFKKCIFKDVRSTPAISEGKRSRNSSEISQPRSRHTSTSSSGMGSVRTMESALRTVEMATAETKIFSVAVSQGKAENSSNMMRNVVMKVCCLIKITNTSGDHIENI